MAGSFRFDFASWRRVASRAVFATVLVAPQAFAVTMNFEGSFRTEGSYYNNTGLGNGAIPKDKAFLYNRALLNPSVVIDDHFSVKSQWSLLSSPTFAPSSQSFAGSAMVVGNGGYILGDPNATAMLLQRAWLEWTSDVGVLRLGRMPFNWGYGLLWDDGSRDIWDDFQTTLDRVEYRLNLGYINFGVSYSKTFKASTLGSGGDSIFFSGFLQYKNPETDFEGGILYENQWRSPDLTANFKGPSNPAAKNPNPWYVPPVAGFTQPNLAKNTPYPLSNHVLDIYVKKGLGAFTLGGEFSYLAGKAIDFGGDGTADDLGAFALVARAQYEKHQLKAYAEVLYATGDDNINDNTQSGFLLLHRNRRPGLILGRELLGPYATSAVSQGSCTAYSGPNTFSGCLYGKVGASYDWTSTISTGLDLIYARKVAIAAGEESSLGFEIDAGVAYLLYQNFTVGGNAGLLLPGAGIGPNTDAAFAVRGTAALNF